MAEKNLEQRVAELEKYNEHLLLLLNRMVQTDNGIPHALAHTQKQLNLQWDNTLLLVELIAENSILPKEGFMAILKSTIERFRILGDQSNAAMDQILKALPPPPPGEAPPGV